MDNNQNKSIKDTKMSFIKRIKKFIAGKRLSRFIIPAVLVLAAAAILNVGISVLNDHVFFPRIDKALVNSLEPKFDIGTRFDIKDLLKKGRVELSADDVSHIGRGKTDLDLSLSYKGNQAHASLDFTDRQLDAVITKDGIAASVSDVEKGNRYGAYFKGVASSLNSSFLNPENKAENALSKAEYQKLVSLAQDLDNSASNSGETKKDAVVVLGEVLKVFNDSEISHREISYDGIYLNGEKRNARTATYDFNKKDVVDFLYGLEALFNSPSDKLKSATEDLLENGTFTKKIEDMGYTLETCSDVAKVIGDVAELFERMDDIDVKLEVAYVTDAVSAITLDCSFGDDTEIELLVDFGARPKKDKTVYVSLLVAKEHSSSQSERRYVFEYSVEKVKKVNTVSAVYSTSTSIKDGYGEELTESRDLFEIVLDAKNDTASFNVGHNDESSVNGAENGINESSYGIRCAMVDRSSKLSLTLLDATANGGRRYEPTGSVVLTLYKRPERIELGEFEEILKMDVKESDAIASAARSSLKNVWDALKNLRPVKLDASSEDKAESDVYFDGFFSYKYEQYYYDQFDFSGNTYERWSYDGRDNKTERGTYFVSGETITFIPEDEKQYEQKISSIGENSFMIEGNLYEKQ
ncbi:MAG: hypothetical protein E7642_07460 [Ruminococcaceae bacterium]|nr:hypothetical protein [Oscillospiraceae bacterium]